MSDVLLVLETDLIYEFNVIGNFYGGLNFTEAGGKYYWSIENYDGHAWQEIPKSLFDELLKFHKSEVQK